MVSPIDPHPSLRIAAYGKLPFYREFLRARCGTAAADAFCEFLDRVPPLPADRGAAPTQMFGAVPGGSGRVLASIWPSSDGQRDFPLACFTSLPEPSEQRSDTWAALEPSLAGFREAYEQLAAQTDPASFEECVTSLARLRSPDQRRPERNSSCGIELRSFGRSSWAGDTEAQLFALWRLRRMLRAIQPDARTTFRLPLSADHPAAPQIDTWIAVWAAATRRSQAPGILTVQQPRPTLLLFAGTAKLEHFATLRGQEVSGVLDFVPCEEPASLDGFDEFHDRYLAQSEQPEVSLASLLTILTN